MRDVLKTRSLNLSDDDDDTDEPARSQPLPPEDW
jgi:hypothetical protein